MRLFLGYVISFLSISVGALAEAFTEISPIKFKFLVMGIVVPFISIYLLSKDENSVSPRFSDGVAAYAISAIMIWLGYEASAAEMIGPWFGLLCSFVLGLFALSIVMKIKKSLISQGGIIDSLADWLKNWIKNKQL